MKYIFSVLVLFVAACSLNGQQSNELKAGDYAKAISAINVQVLDVRTADEFRSGHLKNALQANWLNKTEFGDRTEHLDKNKPVYIYCLSGGRSAAAAEALRAKGYQVTNLQGGTNAWKNANLPLEGAANAQQTTLESYQVQINSTALVLVDFGATWCPPCVKMEPVLQAFMKEQAAKLTLVKMDGGVETNLMQSLNVEALPTFILYKNGKEIKRKQGLVSREEFNAWIQ